jgi:hypothetical protein
MIEALAISKNYYRVILFSPRGDRDNSDNRAQDARPDERPPLILPVGRNCVVGSRRVVASARRPEKAYNGGSA